MSSPVEHSEPLSTDDQPDRRGGCGRLIVLFVVIPGIVLACVIICAIAYLAMFSCGGAFYESGCDYRGVAAGTMFVVVATCVGSVSLNTIAALVKSLGSPGWQSWVWSTAAALAIALVVLFVGSPWPTASTDALPTTTAPPTTTAAPLIPTTAPHIPTTAPVFSTTSTTMVISDGIPVLHGNGVGLALFGMPLEVAVRGVEHYLGPPDMDDHNMYYSVEWRESGLVLLFSSDDFYRGDRVEHLVAWELEGGSDAPLRTTEGVGIGHTFEVLLAAHPSQIAVPDIPDECLPQWYVWLNAPSTDQQHRVLVVFDGPVEDQDSRISHMRAGAGYGC